MSTPPLPHQEGRDSQKGEPPDGNSQRDERARKKLKKNGKKGHFWIFFWYLYIGGEFSSRPLFLSSQPLRSVRMTPPIRRTYRYANS